MDYDFDQFVRIIYQFVRISDQFVRITYQFVRIIYQFVRNSNQFVRDFGKFDACGASEAIGSAVIAGQPWTSPTMSDAPTPTCWA